MESKKVKVIKEILESCADDKKPCYKCKYYGKCEKLLDKQDILTLINELESENKSLQDLCNKTYEDLTKEIDRLEKENESLYDSYNKGYKVGYGYGKQDAISSDRAESDTKISETTKTDYTLKQFAERLKEIPFNIQFTFKESSYEDIKKLANLMKEYSIKHIDETLKEFIKGVEE